MPSARYRSAFNAKAHQQCNFYSLVSVFIGDSGFSTEA